MFLYSIHYFLKRKVTIAQKYGAILAIGTVGQDRCYELVLVPIDVIGWSCFWYDNPHSEAFPKYPAKPLHQPPSCSQYVPTVYTQNC